MVESNSSSEEVSNMPYEESTTQFVCGDDCDKINTPENPEQKSFVCPVCFSDFIIGDPDASIMKFSCGHMACCVCSSQYTRTQICDRVINIRCIYPDCKTFIQMHEIALLNTPDLVERYDKNCLENYLSLEPSCRRCPQPDCDYCVFIHEDAANFICEKCRTNVCASCGEKFHKGKCKEKVVPLILPSDSEEETLDFSVRRARDAEQCKQCPRCRTWVLKIDDGGCNHIKCHCGCDFCWLCNKEIVEAGHFLTFSGCTYFSRKPWNKGRRVAIETGVYTLAPLAISMAAVAAIPSVAIGLPIYIVKKSRKKEDSLKKTFTKGVLAMLVSPIIGGLTAAFVIPAALLYVYVYNPACTVQQKILNKKHRKKKCPVVTFPPSQNDKEETILANEHSKFKLKCFKSLQKTPQLSLAAPSQSEAAAQFASTGLHLR
ncbi:hypothetical protein Zmor_008962 [Zophobas morio]|jgi:hypothetical protein|uniref:RBR-type E3 ubiquitin transferase n=1 Tax=Zophobas morio TaxID=2755281 RepID=A0AA38LZX8_9CUCU|nr:hypothetical protein Zmor_008962 [Zophobas morio]